MAVNGGLAGPRDDGPRDPTEECLAAAPAVAPQTVAPQTTGERHLRIVHSTDVPSRVSHRQVPRARPATAGTGGPPTRGQNSHVLDRTIQGQIGRMLRDVFAGVANEPVPERFVALLDALGAQEKQP